MLSKIKSIGEDANFISGEIGKELIGYANTIRMIMKSDSGMDKKFTLKEKALMGVILPFLAIGVIPMEMRSILGKNQERKQKRDQEQGHEEKQENKQEQEYSYDMGM